MDLLASVAESGRRPPVRILAYTEMSGVCARTEEAVW